MSYWSILKQALVDCANQPTGFTGFSGHPQTPPTSQLSGSCPQCPVSTYCSPALQHYCLVAVYRAPQCLGPIWVLCDFSGRWCHTPFQRGGRYSAWISVGGGRSSLQIWGCVFSKLVLFFPWSFYSGGFCDSLWEWLMLQYPQGTSGTLPGNLLDLLGLIRIHLFL